MPKSKIVEITPSPIETIRKQLDDKIEDRVSYKVFFSYVTIFATIIAGLITYVILNNNKIDATNLAVAHLQTKIDTKIEDHKIG
jgi:hypothetical protein